MKKRTIKPHIIHLMRNIGLKFDEALSEWIDNAIDAGATHITIRLFRDHISISDNGVGVRNLNLLVDLGESMPPELVGKVFRIGTYGGGGKLAQLYFGNDVTVESVHRGEYRRQRLNWREIEQANDLGYEWDPDRTLSISKASPLIKDGGTQITVREVHKEHYHRRLQYLDDILLKLTHRYGTGLANGLNVDVLNLTKPGQPKHILSPKLDAIGGLQTAAGEVAGLKFEVRYGTLKEQSRLLSGVHFDYGWRNVCKTTALGSESLPPKLYAKVILTSPEWKDCLNPWKTKIVKHEDELDTAVYAIVKDLIAQLAQQEEQLHIEEFESIFADAFANVLVFKPREDNGGRYCKGPLITTTPGNGEGPGPGPNPREKNYEAILDLEDGTGDAQERKRRIGIGIRRDDTLGEYQAATYEWQPASRKLTIIVNGSKTFIADAYRKPYKVNVMWGIAAGQIAAWARDLAADGELEQEATWLINVLKKAGFTVNADDPAGLFDAVNCFVVDRFVDAEKQRTAA